jgi:hypothetical protein
MWMKNLPQLRDEKEKSVAPFLVCKEELESIIDSIDEERAATQRNGLSSGACGAKGLLFRLSSRAF